MEYKIYLMESDNGNNWSGTKLENCYDKEDGLKKIKEYENIFKKIRFSLNSKNVRLSLIECFRTEIELEEIGTICEIVL